MWIDSGAGALTVNSFLTHLITFFLLVLILVLFGCQYLQKRKNKPMSKIIAGLGIALSILIFLNHLEDTFAHIKFLKEQEAIVSESHYFDMGGFRKGWIKSGYRNIVISIIESTIFGLLPLWLFYRQYISKNILKND
tara:strand:+ start:271 stop:681 length:411 start_codon:yes stop_codon:yes gene_type:complete